MIWIIYYGEVIYYDLASWSDAPVDPAIESKL
jgi:hypothetical protein